MKINVLGPGCPKCKKVFENAQKAVGELGLSAEVVKEAARIADSEVSPIDDVRGTAKYKRLLLRQLIYAHFVTIVPELEVSL